MNNLCFPIRHSRGTDQLDIHLAAGETITSNGGSLLLGAGNINTITNGTDTISLIIDNSAGGNAAIV